MTVFKMWLMTAGLSLLLIGGAAEAGAAGNKRVIRIAVTGDIMMGTDHMLPADGGAGAFAEVAPYLRGRQVVIGNLEGPLTNRGAPSKAVVEGVSYVFRTPPHYVERLREAGFTVMSLANNHANDYGPQGYQQTREVLDKAGIFHTGGPGQVARQKVGRTTVSVIGLAPNSGCQNLNDIPAAAELVRREAARPNTLVVVVFHGGGEGEARVRVPQGPETFLGENRGDLRRLGRELIDAGAHLVAGHGPHVPRGLEIYKDRLIVYSLGNFVTGRGLSISGRKGLAPLLLVDIDRKGKLVGGRIVSFRQNQAGRASLDPDGRAAKLMHGLSLADFDQPALDPDGRLLTTDAAALKMAADIGPARRTLLADLGPAEPAPAKKSRSPLPAALAAGEGQGAEVPAAKKVRAKRSAKVASAGGYDWDIYRAARGRP